MDMEQMGEQGVKMYNTLRDFYDLTDRLALLHYIVDYADFEAAEKGADFETTVRRIGYEAVKDLYEKNLQNLREDKPVPIPLELGLKRFLLELRKEGVQ